MEKEKFKKSLSVTGVGEQQKKLAEEKIIGEIFREIRNLDLEPEGKGPKLEEIVKKIAKQYQITENSELMKMMIEDLNSGKYQYKLDPEGNILANYSYMYKKARERDKKLYQEAIENRREAIEIAKRLMREIEAKGEALSKEAVLKYIDEDPIYKERHRTWINLLYEKEIVSEYKEDMLEIE